MFSIIRVILLFIACCLLFVCSHQYNPFEDPANSKVLVYDKNFAYKDSIDIFSTCSLVLAFMVPELADSFCVRVDTNRLSSSSIVYRTESADFPANKLDTLNISFFEPGKKNLELTTYRKNGDIISTSVVLNVKSPLFQKNIRGQFGLDTIHLQTRAVKDRDLVYMWDFGQGVVIRSDSSSIKSVIRTGVKSNTGNLWVTDGKYSSPKVPFTFNLIDTLSPVITFLEDRYEKNGDTIKTSDKRLLFKLNIQDSGRGIVSEALIENVKFDSFYKSAYYWLFDSLNYSKEPKKLKIYAVDDFGNDTTVTVFLVYDPSIRARRSVNVTILQPQADTNNTRLSKVLIMVEVEQFTNDKGSLILEFKCNNTVYTHSLEQAYRKNHYWSPILLDSINHISVTVKDSTGKIIATDNTLYLLNPALEDETAPRIDEINVDGIMVGTEDSVYITKDTVMLKIIAFDDGTGVNHLLINDVDYAGSHKDTLLPYIYNIKRSITKRRETLVIKAVDSLLEDVKRITIIKNNRPTITVYPKIIKPFYAGEVYHGVIEATDPDYDIPVYSAKESIAGFSVSRDGKIVWESTVKDNKLNTFTVCISDGYETIEHILRITPIDSSIVIKPVKFITTGADFTKSIQKSDSLKIPLRVDTTTGIAPYVFQAINKTSGRKLEIRGDTLLINSLDTGSALIEIIVKDSHRDTTSDAINVIIEVLESQGRSINLMGNFKRTAAGAVDLSDSTGMINLPYMAVCPETVRDSIKVKVNVSGVNSFYTLSAENTFMIPISMNSKVNSDSIGITIYEKNIPAFNKTEIIYYGSMPFEPSNPFPANNSNVSESLISFSWAGGDIDNFVLYEFYIGNDTLVRSDKILDTNSFNGKFFKSGKYIWKVVAIDNKNRKESTLWSFVFRAPDHVQFKTSYQSSTQQYAAMQDSIIIPLQIQEKTGRGPFKFSAFFEKNKKSISIVNESIRYLPVQEDIGLQNIVVTVIDSFENSDTVIIPVSIKTNAPLQFISQYKGKYTLNGEFDLSGDTGIIALTFQCSVPNPEFIKFSLSNLESVITSDSTGFNKVEINLWKTDVFRDTLWVSIRDSLETFDTSFVIYYGIPHKVFLAPVYGSGLIPSNKLDSLEWYGVDPHGEALIYDLYFGTSIDPPIYQLGIETSSIVFPSPLGIGTYYWRVKAKNARYSTLGPVWKAIVSDIKSVNINTGFNGVDIANDIYNIPVLVRLDSTNYSFSKPNDLLGFRRGNDLSKILPHQIDSWNSTDKQAAVWVLVDTIKANDAKQYFYMLVDSINLASSGLDVFKTSDGFAGVWHLEESQSGTVINGVYKDATGNGYHGFDSISSPAIGGVVGMGQPFTSVSDRIILPPNIPLGSSTDAITYDVWFNTYGDLSGHTLLSFTVNDGTVNRTRLEVTIQPEGNIVVSTTLQNDSLYSLTSNKFDPFFSWHHAAIVLDYVNDSAFIYIDGILNNHSNVQNLGSIDTLVTSTSLIGSRPSEMIGMPNFKGIMDEVRFQHFRRSDDWIKFSYNNQKTGSTIVQIK